MKLQENILIDYLARKSEMNPDVLGEKIVSDFIEKGIIEDSSDIIGKSLRECINPRTFLHTISSSLISIMGRRVCYHIDALLDCKISA